MVATGLRGRIRAQAGCPTCEPMTDRYTYGLGIVISGNWPPPGRRFGLDHDELGSCTRVLEGSAASRVRVLVNALLSCAAAAPCPS